MLFRRMKTITPADAARALEDGDLQVVDIRPPADVSETPIERALNIPFGELSTRLGEIDPARPVAFVCRAGVKSQDAAKLAKDHGLDALSVEGGADAWRSGR